MDKNIMVDGVEHKYDSKLKVNQFQKLSGIIGKLSDSFAKQDMTAGEFSGILAKEGALMDVVCIILNKEIDFIEKLEYSIVLEVVNDFFFTNGLWLMVSGFIPMHSEVSKTLMSQNESPIAKTSLENSEDLDKKKTKQTKSV